MCLENAIILHACVKRSETETSVALLKLNILPWVESFLLFDFHKSCFALSACFAIADGSRNESKSYCLFPQNLSLLCAWKMFSPSVEAKVTWILKGAFVLGLLQKNFFSSQHHNEVISKMNIFYSFIAQSDKSPKGPLNSIALSRRPEIKLPHHSTANFLNAIRAQPFRARFFIYQHWRIWWRDFWVSQI